MTITRPALTPKPGTTHETPGALDTAEPNASERRRMPSADLFRGAREVEIVHREQVYRLRQTALGKLILTK